MAGPPMVQNHSRVSKHRRARPCTTWSYFAAHRADIVAEEYPALAGVALGDVKEISYKARDGTAIPAYLTTPAAKSAVPIPLVVLPHGGPQARDYLTFDWLPQFLASRGYAVLQPQFRGSSGFGDAFQEVTDLPALMRETVPIYGGTLSTTLSAWKARIGATNDSNLAAKSPINAVKSIKIPVLILYGTGDGVVPNEQSERMVRALTAAGKNVAVAVMAGEDHWLSRTEARVQVLKELEAFLAKNL
jgi:dipeptidyl aminopeptidase/acylaminoacyl peptidase